MNLPEQNPVNINPFAPNPHLQEQAQPVESPTYDASQDQVSLGIEDDYYEQLRSAKKEKAKKDMLYGALWCVGGTIATVAQTGFIFWGAIVFGGIQFFRGLANING